jgi:outer membrane lipoprotein-sorting protein
MKRPESMLLAAAVWLALALAAPCAQAKDLQLPELMQMLAHNKSGKATFEEKKYIGVLEQPVVATGKITFVSPDVLEKRTLTPKRESMILNGNLLTFERPGKPPMTINLDERPEASAFIGSIRSTLTGNLSALQSFYSLKLVGSAGQWQLTLWPRGGQLGSLIDHILISGAHADIRTVEIAQRDGDHSEMTITSTSINR